MISVRRCLHKLGEKVFVQTRQDYSVLMSIYETSVTSVILKFTGYNFSREVAAFVAGIDDGPAPVVALVTDNAEDVLRIADALDAVFDAIPTYPMWLIGTVGLDLYIPPGSSARSRRFGSGQPWRRVYASSSPSRLKPSAGLPSESTHSIHRRTP